MQWVSERLKNKHALHPSFSHGSTLGLYEVLTGKSYFCDIITDSVVHCFFIEAEKIFALVPNSAAEDFLWQVFCYLTCIQFHIIARIMFCLQKAIAR